MDFEQLAFDLLAEFQRHPNQLLAIIVLIVFYLISRRVKGRIEEFISTDEEDRQAGQGLVRLVQFGIFLLGGLIALAIAFPNLVPTWDPTKLPLNIDLSLALQKVIDIINGLIVQFPNIVLALIVYAFFRLASGWVRAATTKILKTSGRSESAAKVFGRLAGYATTIAGVMIALVIVIPGFDPTTIAGGLGIGSVAIGFAFRDILQNFLAGLLLLLTDPFKIGDQIVVKGFEGTVDDIQIRATILRTYDGRQVVIPNSDVFTESVVVNTAYNHRRSQYDVGIGYGDDINQAIILTMEAMQSIEGVLDVPTPTVQVVDLADSTVNLRALWWTDSQNRNVTELRNQVLIAINKKLTHHGIDLPFPTQVVLFHDQTEETDGDRLRQREGWPAGQGQVPKPQRIVDVLQSQRR